MLWRHGTGTSALGTPARARQPAASSGSVPGGISAGNGQGFVINVVYDSSVANAPAGFTQTIANVVNFYESQFSTPLTITIDVGYGEIDGQSMRPAALGESQAYMTSVSYAQLQSCSGQQCKRHRRYRGGSELVCDQSGERPVLDPDGGSPSFGAWPARAVSMAMPVSPTFRTSTITSATIPGTVPGSQYDFFGAVAHEFSEIMGRQMLDGAADFGGAARLYRARSVPLFGAGRPRLFRHDARLLLA